MKPGQTYYVCTQCGWQVQMGHQCEGLMPKYHSKSEMKRVETMKKAVRDIFDDGTLESLVTESRKNVDAALAEERAKERQEILEMLQEAHDNIIAQDEPTMAYRNGLGWAIRKIKQRGEKEGE